MERKIDSILTEDQFGFKNVEERMKISFTNDVGENSRKRKRHVCIFR